MNGIKEIFVPDEDYISAKIDYLRSKFVFVDSIIGTAESIMECIYGAGNSGVPRITMDLSASNSKYNYGSSTLALDMSWYTPYKPTVDVVLSAILWVTFCWRVFVHLPGIINGASGVISKVGKE